MWWAGLMLKHSRGRAAFREQLFMSTTTSYICFSSIETIHKVERETELLLLLLLLFLTLQHIQLEN